MLVAFLNVAWIERFFGWLFVRRRAGTPAPAPQVVAEPFQLPLLFAQCSAPGPGRQAPRPSDVAPARPLQDWRFAARLQSVAARNVPKGRKGPVLKTYEATRAVTTTKPWNSGEVRSGAHASNVVALARRPRWAHAPRGLAVERLAA